VIALVFVQVYLIAAYIFGEPGALGTHMTVGRVVVFFEFVVLPTALIGWRGRQIRALQASLAKDVGNSPWVHVLHGMLALVVLVLVLALLIAVRTWRQAFARTAVGRGT
jgi:hypothetical protein